MTEKLPVARCGDCLYWQISEQDYNYAKRTPGDLDFVPVGECHIRSNSCTDPLDNFPWRTASNWCGEFVHRVLGPRVEILVDAEQGRFETEHQNWRFPTEPEE